MIILDTDILSLLMYGDERVIKRFARESHIAISIVTRIEMLQGRFASIMKAPDNTELLMAQSWLIENERFLEQFPILFFDEQAANEFLLLRRNKKLKKIGNADLLIAAIALAKRATLVTRNTRHFGAIPALRTENWAS